MTVLLHGAGSLPILWRRARNFQLIHIGRIHSIQTHGGTVRVPVELIPLERARTMTFEGSGEQIRLELSLARSTGGMSKHLSLSNSALHNSSPSSSLSLHQNISSSLEILDISQPVHLEKSLSYSPQRNQLSVPARNISPYAPQADTSPCSSTSSDKDRPHSAPEDEASMQIEAEVQQSARHQVRNTEIPRPGT